MNNTQNNSKKKLPSLIVPGDIEVLICSTGGVGSTFLINFVNNYKKTNSIGDNDNFKHLFFPPLSYNKNIKYIYIFGNPIDSVISLFNRNHYRNHSRKMCTYKNTLTPIPAGTSLNEYAAGGIDRFLFSEQFKNWLSLSHFYPTLFLKYEKMWDNLEVIYDFLEIPRADLKSFPEKKNRNSDFLKLEKTTQKNLKNIYGKYEQYINDFEDCLIVNDRKKPLFPNVLFSMPFYHTARRSMGRKINDISPKLLNHIAKLYFSKLK